MKGIGIIIVLLIIMIMIILPPWEYRGYYMTKATTYTFSKSAGYSFIWNPPSNEPNWDSKDLGWEQGGLGWGIIPNTSPVGINWVRLFLQICFLFCMSIPLVAKDSK